MCDNKVNNINEKHDGNKNNGFFINLKNKFKGVFKKSIPNCHHDNVKASQNFLPKHKDIDVSSVNNSEYVKTALQAIDEVSPKLREISLKIHEHPELGGEEKYAHDLLVAYLRSEGFEVTPSAYGIATAFIAEFRSKAGKGKVVSFNSEYDALPGIGHACGHNLIAISGVAAAIGIKSVIEKYEIEGTVKLLGTPDEERTNGKIDLIEAGAYDNVDISLMVHPSNNDATFLSFLALRPVTVEYFGKNSHAAVNPWGGINALDALISAYNNISLLRQQILPTDRVHGVITNGGQAPNIIPDYTSGSFYVRSKTIKHLRSLQQRVQNCFDAASKATGTKMKINWGREVYDVKTNEPLATRYEYYLTKLFGKKFLPKFEQLESSNGSTDQGNVTYVVPGIHPKYDIHPLSRTSIHTIGFADAAKTTLAHEETIIASKGITLVGLDFLIDDEFSKEVKESFAKN